MGFRNAGAKAGAPCSPAMSQGFPDLQMINFAASAECGRTERPIAVGVWWMWGSRSLKNSMSPLPSP